MNGFIKYRFLNEKGENIIDLNNIKTLPISYRNSFKEVNGDKIRKNKHLVNNVWNYNGGRITHSRGTKIYYYTPSRLYGFDKAKTYNTYLRINEKDTDTITMRFTTDSKDCDGGPYCATTNELYYNGTIVYSDGKFSKEFEPKYVDIIKKQGKTEVKVIK